MNTTGPGLFSGGRGAHGYNRKRNACRWTQLKFYWTLVKIINKWIHCHHVRIQWTKTMHLCVVFLKMSSGYVLCDQPSFLHSRRRREDPHLQHVVQIDWGDIPIRWVRAHVWGLSECFLLGTWFRGTLNHKLYGVQFSSVFSIDGHV